MLSPKRSAEATPRSKSAPVWLGETTMRSPVGVPSATGKRCETTGLHENENALLTEQI